MGPHASCGGHDPGFLFYKMANSFLGWLKGLNVMMPNQSLLPPLATLERGQLSLLKVCDPLGWEQLWVLLGTLLAAVLLSPPPP